MSKHYWIAVIPGERGGEANVMQLLPDRLLYRSTTIKGMEKVIARLKAGGDAEFTKPSTLMLPDIASLEYEVDWTAIVARDKAGKKHVVFGCESKTDTPRIALELAGLLGLSTTPVRRVQSVSEFSWGPGIIGAIVLVMTTLLFLAAGAPDTGTQRYGRAGTMKALSEGLGQTGILAIGLVLLAAIAAWWLYLYKNPPQVQCFRRRA